MIGKTLAAIAAAVLCLGIMADAADARKGGGFRGGGMKMGGLRGGGFKGFRGGGFKFGHTGFQRRASFGPRPFKHREIGKGWSGMSSNPSHGHGGKGLGWGNAPKPKHGKRLVKKHDGSQHGGSRHAGNGWGGNEWKGKGGDHGHGDRGKHHSWGDFYERYKHKYSNGHGNHPGNGHGEHKSGHGKGVAHSAAAATATGGAVYFSNNTTVSTGGDSGGSSFDASALVGIIGTFAQSGGSGYCSTCGGETVHHTREVVQVGGGSVDCYIVSGKRDGKPIMIAGRGEECEINEQFFDPSRVPSK